MRKCLSYAFKGALVAALVICGSARALEMTDEQIAVVAKASMRGAGGPIYEDVLASLVRPIRAYDFAKDGLDEADLARAKQVRDARLRGPALGNLLAFDLDNNQRVTRQEYDTATRISPIARLLGMMSGGPAPEDPFVQRDEDRDDVLTWAEMSKPMQSVNQFQEPLYDVAAILVAVDPTPDGFVSTDDARALAESVFARLDEDRSGTLEQDEIEPINRSASRARVRAKLGRPAN